MLHGRRENIPRVYSYPGCCLFFHEELISGNVSWLTTLFTDRPSHPKRTMAYLRSSSITVAGPPGNHTPFRFSRSSDCYGRRTAGGGQGRDRLKPDRGWCRCRYLLKRFSVLFFLAILLIDKIIRLVNRIFRVLKSLIHV